MGPNVSHVVCTSSLHFPPKMWPSVQGMSNVAQMWQHKADASLCQGLIERSTVAIAKNPSREAIKCFNESLHEAFQR
jgi:hypothetical protein